MAILNPFRILFISDNKGYLSNFRDRMTSFKRDGLERYSFIETCDYSDYLNTLSSEPKTECDIIFINISKKGKINKDIFFKQLKEYNTSGARVINIGVETDDLEFEEYVDRFLSAPQFWEMDDVNDFLSFCNKEMKMKHFSDMSKRRLYWTYAIVMFIDIQGFTSDFKLYDPNEKEIDERPEKDNIDTNKQKESDEASNKLKIDEGAIDRRAELIDIIDILFGKIRSIIHNHNGYIDKFIGDCVLAVFEDPDKKFVAPELALKAVNAAIKIRKEMISHKQTVNIGMDGGEVFKCFFGEQTELQYTIMGNPVNKAQRCQDVSHDGQILISPHTFNILQNIRDEYEKYFSLSEKTKYLYPEAIKAVRPIEYGEAFKNKKTVEGHIVNEK